MRIKIEGGFASAKRDESGKIGLAIGCDHFNTDGTRKDTVVNTALITEAQLTALFSDVFSQEYVEDSDEESSEKAEEAI